MDASVCRRRFQVSIQASLLLIACFAVFLLICPAVWQYATIPRPTIGNPVTNPLVDNVELELQVFACDLAVLEGLNLTLAGESTYVAQVVPTMSQQAKQFRAASRWRNWKAIAFPRITTPSGVPQSYARTVNGLFGDTADYRIDLVPIALGNGQLRREVRTELVAAARQQATDVAMEIGVDETLIIACKVSNGGTANGANGLITIATPTWTTAGMECHVALQRSKIRGRQGQ